MAVFRAKFGFMLAERPAKGRSCASCARGINASMHVMAGLGPKKNSTAAPEMACPIYLTTSIRHPESQQFILPIH
ncbi:MAG TPA: hypothetical protein QGF41_13415 [Gammaproteobacteria bacterium]|nr:hypothetical protein [Gammaproteobacteria bacterium]